MMNTGTKPVPSTHGLLTTVAYQIGADGPVHYALEGSVAFAGATIQWLRDHLCIIKDAAESETLAASTTNNDGLYFVPAFSGLLAPYWRSDARGCIVGMCASHHKGHICRAALESAAYQTKSVFDAITADCDGIQLQQLKVDGGGTNNRLSMQFQADIINVPVIKPVVMETTAMGAAFAAGLAVGVWSSVDEIQQLRAVSETFQPSMSDELRNTNWNGWKKAIQRSFGWVTPGGESFDDGAAPNGSGVKSTEDQTCNAGNESNKTVDLVASINQQQKQLEKLCQDVGIPTASFKPESLESSNGTVVHPGTKEPGTISVSSSFVGEVYDLDDEIADREIPEDAKKILSPRNYDASNGIGNSKSEVHDVDVVERASGTTLSSDGGSTDKPAVLITQTTAIVTAVAALGVGIVIGTSLRRR